MAWVILLFFQTDLKNLYWSLTYCVFCCHWQLGLLISIICCFIFKLQTLFGKIQRLSIKEWLKFMSCHESIIVNLSSCIVHLLLQHCFQILFMSSLNVKIVWSFALISISCDNKKDNLKILIYEVGKSLWHNRSLVMPVPIILKVMCIHLSCHGHQNPDGVNHHYYHYSTHTSLAFENVYHYSSRHSHHSTPCRFSVACYQ